MSEDSNTITDLRTHLFDAIKLVKAGSIKVDQARAISDLAGRIIESAKAETEAVKAFGRGAVPASGFIGSAPKPDTLDKQERGGVVHQHQTTDAAGNAITYERREPAGALPGGPRAQI